jgi:predicted PurR-regulated permease PerM
MMLRSTRALLVAAGYLAVNTLFGSIIEPRVMGRGLGLSTLVVFVSLVFWGWVLGPIGMLLSVLLTMIVKIALESHEDTRWAAVLLGSAKSIDGVDSLPEETVAENADVPGSTDEPEKT